jgi:iron-sulfur cluster assembly protein
MAINPTFLQIRSAVPRKEGGGVALGEKTGCSGWAYVVKLAEEVKPDDIVFEDRGIKILVPAKPGLPGWLGVDFSTEGLGHSFQFRNPNVATNVVAGELYSDVMMWCKSKQPYCGAGPSQNPPVACRVGRCILRALSKTILAITAQHSQAP